MDCVHKAEIALVLEQVHAELHADPVAPVVLREKALFGRTLHCASVSEAEGRCFGHILKWQEIILVRMFGSAKT